MQFEVSFMAWVIRFLDAVMYRFVHLLGIIFPPK
jgi:hypothetical protein